MEVAVSVTTPGHAPKVARMPASVEVAANSLGILEKTSERNDCESDGGVWSEVPLQKQLFGCKLQGSECGPNFPNMFAADFSQATCPAGNLDRVASTTKSGAKLCWNGYEGNVFSWHCSDNDPNRVQTECANRIADQFPDFFTEAKTSFDGTYLFPNGAGDTLQYPSNASISCYSQFYCNQKSSHGSLASCDMAVGTSCWPDFGSTWLKSENSHTVTTLTSRIKFVYCSK
jgi:hypothetical protein